MSDGKVTIDTRMDSTGAEKGMAALSKLLVKLGKLAVATFSIKSIINFGKECTEIASDLTEVQNVVDTAFGSMSYKIENFADTCIENFGMSELSAKQMASTMMSMGTAMGQAQDIGSDMAVELTGRLGDISSFYNKTLDEVNTLGRAVYSGETESLKQIGVLMTQDNLKQFALEQGYKTSYDSMTAQQKLLVRQQYFLKATDLAAGDFVKTQDSWANQTKILSERWKQLMGILGNGLIAVLKPVVKTLNSIVAALINVANTISKVMAKVFGKTAETISSATSSTEDYTDATEETAAASDEASEAAEGETAAFDDLDVLQQDSGSGSGDEGAGTDVATDVEALDDAVEEEPEFPWLDNLLDKFELLKQRVKELLALFAGGLKLELFKADIFDRLEKLKQKLQNIGKLLLDIFSDPEVVQHFNDMLDTLAFNAGRIVGAFISIGLTIAENLIGGIEKYLTENSDRIKEHLITMFDITAEISTLVADFTVAFANVFSVFGGENGQQVTANIIGIFTDAFMGIQEFASKFAGDVLQLFVKPFVDNQEEIKKSLDDFLGNLSDVIGSIKKFVDNAVDSLNKLYDDHIKPFMDSLAQGLSDIEGKFLEFWQTYIQPVLDLISQKFDEIHTQYLTPLWNTILEVFGILFDKLTVLWQEYLVPLIEWFIENILPVIQPIHAQIVEGVTIATETVITILTDVVDTVGKIIEDVSTIFAGLIEFLTGVFTGDWETAWQGITDIFSGVKDLLCDIINGILSAIEALANGVVKGINKVIDVLNGMSFEIPDWVPEFGGKTFGLNIPKLSEISIPRLATGAVIPPNKEFLAVLGDQKSGTNIETPLDTMLQAFEQVAASMLKNVSTTSDSTTMELDGETFARLEMPYILAEMKRKGYKISVLEA